MKQILICCFAICCLISCNSPKPELNTDTAVSALPTDDQIVNSYLYLFARYLVIQQENFDINTERVGYNKVKYNPLGSAQFVNPNLDVAYLESWIAVDSNHAVILNIPKVKGRFYTAEILNGWGEVIININDRTFPKTPYGNFAFVLKGTNPQIPTDAIKIELPSTKAKMLARVELKGTPAIAQKLQHQFTITAPEEMKIDSPLSIPSFTHAQPIGGIIFEDAARVMASYPDVMPRADTMQKQVTQIQLYYNSSATAKAHVDSVVSEKAIPAFLSGAKGFGTQKGGWSVSYAAGTFGNDMLARDIIDYGGLWANAIQEAIYFIGLTDSSRKLLNGNNQYEIRFPAGAIPDSMVHAFWSLSLYSVPDYRVVDNPLKRYNLNNVSGLQKNKDSSLSIWLASSLPANIPKSNWLPTPPGKGFALTLRMYVPKEDVISGKWFPASIQRIK